jgi:WD40 repeat protein
MDLHNPPNEEYLAERLVENFLTGAWPPQGEVAERVKSASIEELTKAAVNLTDDTAKGAFLYGLWRVTKHPRLTTHLTETGWKPDFGACLQVFNKLEHERTNELKNGKPLIVRPLLDALEDPDPDIRARSMECLKELTNQDTIDALCDIWARERQPGAREVITFVRYVAVRPARSKILTALVNDAANVITECNTDEVRALINALDDSDPDIRNRAERYLPRLRRQEAIDLLCAVWTESRDEALGRAIEEARYRAGRPVRARVLSALKSNRAADLDLSSPDALRWISEAASDREEAIRDRALNCIKDAAEAGECADAVCRAVIEHGSDAATEALRAYGLIPDNIRDRAVFHFLCEQWPEYEAIDFDMSLLRDVFENAGTGLRQRIARSARRAGRLELVELVAGQRRKRRMGEMTIREWQVSLSILTERRDWEGLWRLARTAPAVWAVEALRVLTEHGWLPEQKPEQRDLEMLSEAAAACTEEAPIVGILDEPESRFVAHTRRVSRVIINSMFDNSLATSSWDGTVRLWSLPDGRPAGEVTAHRHPISSLAATPDGSMIVTGSGAEGSAKLWAMPDGEKIRELPGHSRGVSALAVSPDGRMVSAGGYDADCLVWRIGDGSLMGTLKGHRRSIRCTTFTPDGDTVITAGEDKVIRLWDVTRMEETAVLSGHEKMIRALVVTPDGKLLISSGSDEDIFMWDMETGGLIRKLEGHTNVAPSMAISGDGRILASAGWDETVRLWILPEGKPWGVLKGHFGPVTCLATDPESRVLISGGHDGRVMMWNFQSGIFRRPTTRADLDRMEELIKESVSEPERRWTNFLHQQMRLRWRHDIEIDAGPERMEIGAFDIEISG